MVVRLERGCFLGQTRARLATPHLNVLLQRHVHGRSETTPVHRHAPPYLALVCRGAFRESAGGTEHLCVPGSMALDTVGEEHQDRFEGETLEVLNIELPQSWLDALRSERAAVPAFVWFTRRDLIPRARLLRAHVERPEALSALVVDGLAAELLLEAARARPAAEGTAAPAWLGVLEDALRARFRRPPPLAELAALVQRSPSQVARAYRQWRGTTLGSFARRLRAEHARRALSETGASLLEIAREAGYSDQSHMTRELGAHLGCTPGRLRRELWERGEPTR